MDIITNYLSIFIMLHSKDERDHYAKLLSDIGIQEEPNFEDCRWVFRIREKLATKYDVVVRVYQVNARCGSFDDSDGWRYSVFDGVDSDFTYQTEISQDLNTYPTIEDAYVYGLIEAMSFVSIKKDMPF